MCQALYWVLGSRRQKDRLGLCPGHLIVPWMRQCRFWVPYQLGTTSKRGGGETTEGCPEEVTLSGDLKDAAKDLAG